MYPGKEIKWFSVEGKKLVPSEKKKENTPNKDWKTFLIKSCFQLMELNHLDIFFYSYSYYKMALESVFENQKQFIISSSLAVKLAFAKQSDFNKFVRGK